MSLQQRFTNWMAPLVGALWVTLAVWAGVQGNHAFAATDRAKLTRLGVVSDPSGQLNVTFGLNKKVTYKYFTLDNPSRVVVDFRNTQKSFSGSAKIDSSLVKGVRYGKQPRNTLRVVFDLKEPVLADGSDRLSSSKKFGVELMLKPLKTAFLQEPPDTSASSQATFAQSKQGKKVSKSNTVNKSKKANERAIASSIAAEKSSTQSLRKIVIAIDAGHGGSDPGAIGPKGTKEKDVVLSIAKQLTASINTRRGYKAVMTRTGDYFVPLAKRREIARDKHKADLFVSIHADAWKRRSARGASVYALSRKGATSALARHLAAHQNSVDRKHGKEQQMLSSVLADLAMEGSMEHSLTVGDFVLSELKQVTKLHKKKVEKAAFAVLKSPDVPSILVETGFISNPREEQNLRSSAHQRKLVKAVTKGIERYFDKQPLPGTWVAYWKGRTPESYRIASGDTLSGIAQKYRISQERLKKANNLNSDVIKIGQVLYIPNG